MTPPGTSSVELISEVIRFIEIGSTFEVPSSVVYDVIYNSYRPYITRTFFGEGFKEFRLAYPEWCESCSELLESPGSGSDLSGSDPNVTVPLMGLRSLRISSSAVASARQKTPALPSSSTEESSSDSEHLDTAGSMGFDDDKDFPIEIVPYLYLGNAANSEDLEALSKHGIQYILNVTPDLPNKFEKSRSMKYMQIPITDHWSQNLASFFPKAIQFIEGTNRESGGEGNSNFSEGPQRRSKYSNIFELEELQLLLNT
ncbi:hypothetical protein V9T40_003743 [Parthenolecanium corni]|uniref:protein-tyrosine-phosphatase n=1 Tax=Parthenolecanium corni TaxID=536013 RepID=A0AAN9TR72_9HEMI